MKLFRRKALEHTGGDSVGTTGGGGRPAETAARSWTPDESDWRAYDSVADEYRRFLEPVTGPPGADLVSLLQLHPGARLLDIGAGTGTSSRAALSDGVFVVGVDPSVRMLAVAQGLGGGPRYVASATIDLPFRNATFTHLIGNFVLSHFPKYETALFDMFRVLAPAGRMGVSAWAMGEDDDEFSTTFQSVLEEFAEHEMLRDAHDHAVPWEERFSDPNRLKDALHEAGLRDIWVEKRQYRVETTPDDYVSSREITSMGRFLRQMLGEQLWETFDRRAREVFRGRFPTRFNDFHEAVLAVGHKP
jgi:ubiquinone/menaquinone biosynthesis C-methylase UbiE